MGRGAGGVGAATRGTGRIGAQATALGVGTKTDGEVLFIEPPPASLLLMPSVADLSWTPDAVENVRDLSERAAALGDLRLANGLRSNLLRPRSCLHDGAALRRMVAAMERRALAMAGELPPVPPAVLYAALSDVPAVHEGTAYLPDVLPAAIAAAAVDGINSELRIIARAGFAKRAEVNPGNAPQPVLDAARRIGNIGGAAVRAINQVGHLLRVSRVGQTPHEPMTLRRRLVLVDAALGQLGNLMGATGWTAEGLALLTPAVRAAWAAREAVDPTPAPFARNLFEWASKRLPDPATLDGAELERSIQQHPDLAYVEVLRGERRWRSTEGLHP